VAGEPDLHAPHSGGCLPNGIAGGLQPLFATAVMRTTISILPRRCTSRRRSTRARFVASPVRRLRRSARSNSSSSAATPARCSTSRSICSRRRRCASRRAAKAGTRLRRPRRGGTAAGSCRIHCSRSSNDLRRPCKRSARPASRTCCEIRQLPWLAIRRASIR